MRDIEKLKKKNENIIKHWENFERQYFSRRKGLFWSVKKKYDISYQFFEYPNVVCLSETWLVREEIENFQNGVYKLATLYYFENFIEGDIMILVRDSLNFEIKVHQ